MKLVSVSPVIARKGDPLERNDTEMSSGPTKFVRDAIYNEAVGMQTRLHFLRTYDTYPGIIPASPIVRIRSIFRLSG